MVNGLMGWILEKSYHMNKEYIEYFFQIWIVILMSISKSKSILRKKS